MLAIIIPADPNEPVARDAVPAGPTAVAEWLRVTIGGRLERIQLTGHRHVWVRETGAGLPVNCAATGLTVLDGAPRVVQGPAVILGYLGPETIGLTRDQFLKSWNQLYEPIVESMTASA